MLRGSLTDLAAFIVIADQLSFRAAASNSVCQPRPLATRCASLRNVSEYAC